MCCRAEINAIYEIRNGEVWIEHTYLYDEVTFLAWTHSLCARETLRHWNALQHR